MINITAWVISLLFHPVVLSVATSFFLVLFFPREVPYSVFWVLYPLVFVGIASFFTFYGVKTRLFSDFDITKRNERGPFYAFIIILSIIYVGILVFISGPKSLIVLGFGVLAGAVIMELVNRKLKASVHVAAVSAFMCTLALLYGGIFILLPIFIPIVAWSRIHIKRHSVSEAVTGGIIGTFITVVLFLVIEYILYFYG